MRTFAPKQIQPPQAPAAARTPERDLPGNRTAGRCPDGRLTRRAEFAGADFSAVRIHHDTAARSAADRLDAAAFTRGQDIFLGTDAPERDSPAEHALLAHELAHVVQQQRAITVGAGEIGAAGDVLEREADAAGRGALMSAAPARVPEMQRQPRGTTLHMRAQLSQTVPRSEVQRALEAYLRRAQQAQGGRTLQLTPVVRAVLQALASLPGPSGTSDAQRVLGMDGWLASRLELAEPASLAQQAMRFLPDPCPLKALQILQTRPVTDEPEKAARVKNLIEQSKAGDPSPDVATVAEQRPPTSSQRFEELAESGGIPGTPRVDRHGPYSVDLLRVGRILSGLPGALASPRPRTSEPVTLSPEAQQAVEQIAARLPADALTPAGEEAGNYADAGEVARGLARQFAELDRQGADRAVLQLGPGYAVARDLEKIFRTIRAIAQQVNAAVPHRGPGVRALEIRSGDRYLRTLFLTDED